MWQHFFLKWTSCCLQLLLLNPSMLCWRRTRSTTSIAHWQPLILHLNLWLSSESGTAFESDGRQGHELVPKLEPCSLTNQLYRFFISSEITEKLESWNCHGFESRFAVSNSTSESPCPLGRAQWAERRGATGYNQLSRAIKNQPFQSRLRSGRAGGHVHVGRDWDPWPWLGDAGLRSRICGEKCVSYSGTTCRTHWDLQDDEQCEFQLFR